MMVPYVGTVRVRYPIRYRYTLVFVKLKNVLSNRNLRNSVNYSQSCSEECTVCNVLTVFEQITYAQVL
jgi:hypothetical protein